MCDNCTDNRFEIIDAAKQDLLQSTNIQSSPAEMAVLSSMLYRCWQMGWLEKYNKNKTFKDSNKDDDRWHY